MGQLDINISVEYDHFTLAIKQQLPLEGITGIFGHSGSGKSTLLRVIAGLTKEAKGDISLKDKILINSATNNFVKPEQRNIGLVFQDSRLFSHLTVEGNLKFAATRCKNPRLKFNELIELTDLTSLLDKKVTKLSGGEQQRVALARALLAEPELLLLDEPLSALDKKNKSMLLSLLSKVQKKFNIPMFYVSHSLAELQQLADNLLVLTSGKVSHFGNVHQIIHQLNNSGLIQQQTSLSLPIKAHLPDYGLTSLQLSAVQEIYLPLIGQPLAESWSYKKPLNDDIQVLRCFIFASDISITKHEHSGSSIVNHLAAKITHISIQQKNTLISVQCQQQVFYVQISLWSTQRLALKVDDDIFIQFKASAVHTLNNLGG
ncbi:MAG: molybdate transport system ATP-binding protein [Alteromonadaceae bacterium]|jgi:molybdate transport system ATP-binding protein